MLCSGDTGRPAAGAAPDAGSRLTGEWALGAILGVANLLQLLCLLLALRSLPAVVVFPVSAALGIVFNALASMLFWGERPAPRGWLGIALSVLAVVLLSWQ
jgi:multidrug transporter EmrE-like cation transporter